MNAHHDSLPPDDFEMLYRRNLDLIRQVDHLSTVREIGLAISASLDLNESLPTIAHVVQGALDVKKLTLFELIEDEDIFRPIIAKYGNDLISRDRLEEESAPRKGSLLGEALDSGSVLLQNGPTSAEAYVPLVAKQEALGVLLLEDQREGAPFSTADAELFRQLASHIAIAIHNGRLYAMAVTDGLTKLYVRRYFDLRLQEEFDAAHRYHRVFSLLLLDIDHFKSFNDTHGHQTGDLVLKQFARLIERSTRKSDICCRYGGEEMAVILPETELEEAALLANKLCVNIRNQVFLGAQGEELSVTASIGVASFSTNITEPGEMVKAADEALYEAKELGRNRVEIANL